MISSIAAKLMFIVFTKPNQFTKTYTEAAQIADDWFNKTGEIVEYSVNGTKAKYHQDDELTKEMTLSVNINYEKIFYKFNFSLLLSFF